MYTRVSVKLIELTSAAEQQRIDEATALRRTRSFLPFVQRAATDSPEAADTIQIPNPANVAVFRCSKFESCKARSCCSRHDNLTLFPQLLIDGAVYIWNPTDSSAQYCSDIYRKDF